MKRKTIKAKLTAALSASMALAMLAPATPAYAATPDPKPNGFKFDFRTNNEAKVPFVKDLYVLGGTAGASITADYKGMQLDPATTGSLGLILPYFYRQSPTDPDIVFNPAQAPTATVDTNIGTESTQTWTALGLNGYKIKEYKDAASNGRSTLTVNPSNFPTTGMTYYATLEADGQIFDYSVKHKYEAGTSYIPGLEDGEITDNVKKPVLSPITNAIPKTIPGYKALPLTGTNGTNSAKLDGDILTTTINANNKSNIHITSDNRVTGETTNKPFSVEYSYKKDDDVKFTIRVFDAKYKSAADFATGGAAETSQQRSSANISQPVLTDVASTPFNISANTAIIGDGSSADQTMYILDATKPVTITYTKGEPATAAGADVAGDNIAVGQFTTDGSGKTAAAGGTGKVIKTIIPAADVQDAHGNTVYTALKADTTSTTGGAHPRNTFKIKGQMPNQNVTITYNYVPNPAFSTNVKVIYVDQLGNNITDKVATAISAVVEPAGAGVARTFYKESGTTPTYLYAKANALQAGETSYNLEIPAPVLNTYGGSSTAPAGLSNPKITTDDNTSWGNSYTTALDNTLQSTWTQSSPKFTVSTTGPLTSQTVYVTYEQDPGSIAYLSYGAGAGGDLKTVVAGNTVDWDPTAPGQSIPSVTKQNVQPDGSYDVVIDPNAATDPTKMPDAVPNQGYNNATWYYGSTAITSFPATIHVAASGGSVSSTVALKAKFTKNTSNWNTYNLAPGNGHVQLLLGISEEVLNVDSHGNPRAITLADLANAALGSGVAVDSGFTAKWFDEDWNEISYGTDITGLVNTTLTVVGVNSTPASVYQPNVTGSLDPLTAKPVLTVDPSAPANIDPTLKYIVTDPVTGNVVVAVSGSQLMSTGGQITNSAFEPGNTYNVSVAPASATGITVGSPIPASAGAGSPGSAQVPVALTPQVAEDSANPGRTSITISPTSTNTDYALVDPSGNVVYPFTTPSAPGAAVTFNNLDPNTIYRVVPRTTGTSATPASRIADGAVLPVDTSNAGLSVNTFDVTVYIPGGIAADPTSMKVNGVPKSSLNDLKNLAPGTTVEILAQSADLNGNLFKEWQGITGISTSSFTYPTGPASGRVIFTMPNSPVTVQPLYDNNQNWSTQYNDNIGSGKQISAGFPSTLADTGDFRILIEKNSVPTAVKDEIATMLANDTFRGIFQMKIVVQKKDASGNWQDYVDPSGNPIPLSTDIVTGSLMTASKEYKFFEVSTLATPSSASGSIVATDMNVSDIEATNAASYTGQFNQTLESGKTYVFGYTNIIGAFKVKVKDSRDNSLVTTFTLSNTNTVNDFESLYRGSIQSDYIDNDGITWHYEGLSKDRGNYDPYDPTLRVTQDETIYLYYSNDKVDRKKAETDLKAAIQNANNQLSKIKDPTKQAALQAAIDAAQAVIDKMNRKSSTAELQAALDALNAALKAAGGDSGGGGGRGRGRGGRGGSGGGSGTAGKKSTGNNSGIRVGLDGNWELMNPAEAQSNPNASKWRFNLTNGGSVTGWAYLTYTYEGRTKSEWYHFGNNNIMDSGWFLDSNNTWYYLSMNHDGFFGEMVKGWHHDGQDGRWYYLDPSSGAMHTNWSKIGGEYYFLNPTAPAQTWFFDNVAGRWNYGDVNSRPFGSMYQNETTPDGYHVNESGAWR